MPFLPIFERKKIFPTDCQISDSYFRHRSDELHSGRFLEFEESERLNRERFERESERIRERNAETRYETSPRMLEQMRY